MLVMAYWLLTACSKDKPPKCYQSQVSVFNTDFAKPNVRIKNLTGVDLCQINLFMNGNTISYGALSVNQSSKYKAFDLIFRYADLKAYIPNDSMQLKILDYTGEVPLTAGFYTYIVRAEPNKLLSVELKKD